MRAWETAAGSSYEEAMAAGGQHGKSNPVHLVVTEPPAAPADMVGLQPFSLIPERATTWLGFLGAGTLLAIACCRAGRGSRTPPREGGRVAWRGLALPILAAALALVPARALPQGGFIFGNKNWLCVPPIDAPVSDMAGVRLAGWSYLAQAYVGLVPDSLTPMGSIVPFRTGANAGYIRPTIITTPWMERWLYVEMRAWEAAAGPSDEAAQAAGGQHGRSNMLRLPVYTPMEMPTDMLGLAPFSLIPEPATTMLGLFGVGVLLLHRR
jgi:hypothetical protein